MNLNGLFKMINKLFILIYNLRFYFIILLIFNDIWFFLCVQFPQDYLIFPLR